MKDKIFLALMEASSAHAKRSRMAFQELGLSTGQPKVLYILNIKEGYLQKELAKVCKIEQPTMTVLLNKMEQQDLIRKEKKIISGGKRAYYVFLTERGKEMAIKVDELINNLESTSFIGLTDQEKQSLFILLDRVTCNLLKDIKEDM